MSKDICAIDYLKLKNGEEFTIRGGSGNKPILVCMKQDDKYYYKNYEKLNSEVKVTDNLISVFKDEGEIYTDDNR